MNDLCGVLNIYKEKGYTSHDVVNIVRNKLNKVKTGHTGTLDPEAEGVLPICIGKATKIADYIASDIKEYKAEITFGATTTTYDHTGDVVNIKSVNSTEQEIISAIESFKGDCLQEPPMYSAIKVNGKKLYELAREGKEIERKKRNITIYDIKVTKTISDKCFEMQVLCSKGTYIRSLCYDIGEKLGCGAYMSSLTRTRTGSFYINDSITVDEFRKLADNNSIHSILMNIDDVMSGYKKVIVSEDANKLLYNGNIIKNEYLMNNDAEIGDNIFIYDCNNSLIGIYRVFDGFIKPLTMLI